MTFGQSTALLLPLAVRLQLMASWSSPFSFCIGSPRPQKLVITCRCFGELLRSLLFLQDLPFVVEPFEGPPCSCCALWPKRSLDEFEYPFFFPSMDFSRLSVVKRVSLFLCS